ncbi:hypothetical protein J2Y74_003314 [Pseudomonas migulae]|nr:hypothetical protein [Pseudomonas migulae]
MLGKYLAGVTDFLAFSITAVEQLTKLMEESNLTTGGHALFCHYQQGLTEYLVIALVQGTEAVTVTEELHLMTVNRLDLDHIRLAARINISEWQTSRQSKQYISYLKGKQGRKISEYFRDFIGCQEGIDGPGETRTLLRDDAAEACMWIKRAIDPDDQSMTINEFLQKALDRPGMTRHRTPHAHAAADRYKKSIYSEAIEVLERLAELPDRSLVAPCNKETL